MATLYQDPGAALPTFRPAARGFPPSLTASEGYTRLETALAGMGFVLNRKHARHRMRVAEALEAAGFTKQRPAGVVMWTRKDSGVEL